MLPEQLGQLPVGMPYILKSTGHWNEGAWFHPRTLATRTTYLLSKAHANARGNALFPLFANVCDC